MKIAIRLFFLLIPAVFAACNMLPIAHITGSIAGVQSGMVLINDQNGRIIDKGKIRDNLFEIKNIFIKHAGFYTLIVAADQRPKKWFSIYLEPATYKINFNLNNDYPAVITQSKMQNELNAYYKIKENINKRKGQLNVNLDADALDAFGKQYPANKIAAHLMINMLFRNEPLQYFKVFNKFNAFNKATPEGEDIREQLTQLVKLMPGDVAPNIIGVTPRGEKADVKRFDTKLTLVEFWRIGNSTCKLNHKAMQLKSFNPGSRSFSIVSVCFDTNREEWLSAAKDDKIKGIQVCDLKGDESPNIKNWAIITVPTYYLLDAQGRIVERDIEFSRIQTEVKAYLAANP